MCVCAFVCVCVYVCLCVYVRVSFALRVCLCGVCAGGGASVGCSILWGDVCLHMRGASEE
jgi:hypothetical protein